MAKACFPQHVLQSPGLSHGVKCQYSIHSAKLFFPILLHQRLSPVIGTFRFLLALAFNSFFDG
jgi:hypothetical protein